MLHRDIPSIELGVMRGSEHAESLEDMRNGSLVERTRTRLLRRIAVILKLDVTEDDDDDEDDEVAQHKLLILVAKDVKTGTNLSAREKE